MVRPEHIVRSGVHRLKRKHYRKYHRCLTVFLAAAGTAALMAGCGQNEAVDVDAQAQSEEQTSDAADGDLVTGDMAAAGTSETAATQKSPTSDKQDTAEEQVEMDEETRRQLTAELLEENGLDTSVVEAERSTRGCTFDLPEGFEESQDIDDLYVTARYPLDTSMIRYAVMDGDISLQLMTEEMFKEQVEENFSLTYGEEIKVNIDNYEAVKIDDYPAFRILCHYQVDEIEITQLEYIINADKTYVITYSQTGDNDWMEAYETSAATISVK